MAFDPVSTLVFFIKPVIFPIDPSAGRLNASLHTSFNTYNTFFSWLEEMSFLQRFIIFLVAISAALSVSASPVQVRHLRTAVRSREPTTFQRRDGHVGHVTALLDRRSTRSDMVLPFA